MKTLIKEQNIISHKSQLTEIFKSGCKNSELLGVEYEKLSVNSKTLKATEYFFKNGILDFLNMYKEQEKLIPCFENEFILGLFSDYGNISLEPGAQVELSLKPQKKICDIEKQLINYNNICAKLSELSGITFLALGIQPLSIYENIKVIPKKRYQFMTKYLRTKATLPYVMMRETAGIQVSIDYKSEEDAILKLSTALKLSPFLSAFFSNSPVRNAELTGYKSFRANAWLNTDNRRCGLISKKLIENPLEFSFEDYANIIADIPMIFNHNGYCGEKTFNQYLEENKIANISDWETHLSLFFPDVRLKKYIEIRNHDCQKMEYALAIPALYKGIMYSENGTEKINELLKDFRYFDFEFVRQNGAKFGIDFKVKNVYVADIVKNIFDIAKEGLTGKDKDEIKYLEPAFELLQKKLTPADIIINNFEGMWQRNLYKLTEYSKIS